jgi:hypothetical protein
LNEITDVRLPDALRSELTNRIKGRGCPVIAWTDHGISQVQIRSIAREIVSGAGTQSNVAAIYIKEFSVHKYGLDRSPMPPEGFVVYAAQPGAPPS